MTRKPDPDARCTAAREALQRLPGALERTWELRFDQGWQPESATPKRPTPRSRPQWVGPTKFQAAYIRATQHLALAHWHLARDTDAEPLWPVDGLIGQPHDTARTVGLGEAHLACQLLTDALTWLHDQYRQDELMPPEANAMVKACDEAEAALNAVPDGLRETPKGCRIAGCQRLPEPDRTTCRRHRPSAAAA